MATAVARGPLTFLLQSSSGQYVMLGMGVYTLFPEQVQRALGPLLTHPAIVSQFGSFAGPDGASAATVDPRTMAPIIIQTPSPTVISGGSIGGRSVTTIAVYAVAGAGACWVGYIVCSQLLPDAVAEFMPVTKRLFKETTQTLGKGILQVKELLEEKIKGLSMQQDQLSAQQEATHKSVKDVEKELGQARSDLASMKSSLGRCEEGLENSQNMQGYSIRGIKLLVRCVTSFLPDESNFIDDIARFVEDGHSSSAGGRDARIEAEKPKTPIVNTSQRRISLPLPQQQPPKIFVPKRHSMGEDTAPTITTIDSDDESSSVGPNNYHAMRDIQALLGH